MVSEPEPFLRAFIANFSCVKVLGRPCSGVKLALPSSQFEQLNIVKHAPRERKTATFHEQDSSVVLWDRTRHPHATDILRTLNDPRLPWQRDLYSHVHGDKETYWLAVELAHAEFSFSPWQASVIGTASGPNSTRSCYWTEHSQGLGMRGGHAHHSPDGLSLSHSNWWVLDGLRILLQRGSSSTAGRVVASPAVADHSSLFYPEGRLCLQGAKKLTGEERVALEAYFRIAIRRPPTTPPLAQNRTRTAPPRPGRPSSHPYGALNRTQIAPLRVPSPNRTLPRPLPTATSKHAPPRRQPLGHIKGRPHIRPSHRSAHRVTTPS